MLKNVSLEQMTEQLHTDNPGWTAEAAGREAAKYMANWDERLSDSVNDFLENRIETDYRHGEFSILLIKALRHNCSYLQAVGMMDAYMKDSVNGKALILRR